MNRGDVYKGSIALPNRASGVGYQYRAKYVVILQGGPDFASDTDVAVVVASTRKNMSPLRPFEVLVGTAQGFHHDTLIDCRWPYTLTKDIVTSGTFLAQLDDHVMHRVSLALLRGLQMKPPGKP